MNCVRPNFDSLLVPVLIRYSRYIAVCCVWHRRNDESYIGHIDPEDIRVICNRAVTSPGGWNTSVDSSSGLVVNAAALELQHQKPHDDRVVLNNQRATPVKQCLDYKTASSADAADASNKSSDAGMSDVLVDNGRILLQYRNVYAVTGVRTTDSTAAKPDDPDTVDRTGPGHVISAPAGKPQPDLQYDMNDVVWKNLAAQY